MRKKIRFPWEIPDSFASELDLRDFWDTHEVTDELLSYSMSTESFEIPVGTFTIQFTIENIPAIRKWNADGTLVSSEYENQVETRLQELKESLGEFARARADRISKNEKIRFDFLTKKAIKIDQK